MIERIKNEPVLLTALVGSLLALLVAFGVDLTEEQTAAVIGVITAASALVARSKVTPAPKRRSRGL